MVVLASLFGPPDISRARLRYRTRAAGYDASARRGACWRALAVASLELKPGETAIDLGCGTGLALPQLADALAPDGRVIAVESSAEMAALARQRIVDESLAAVELIEAVASEARLPPWDGLLLHCVHDILRDPATIAGVMALAKPGARVAVVGMKLPTPWAAPLWPWVFLRAWPYMTTFEGLREPWSHLARHLDDWQMRPINLGTGYVGVGRVRHSAPRCASEAAART